MTKPSHSIDAVERDVGLSKDVLRKWERRYGFPSPSRDCHGDRAYSDDEIHRLRLIKRLIDQGRRPGSVVALKRSQLEQLLDSTGDTASPECPIATDVARLLRDRRVADLRTTLNQMLLRQGLQHFVRNTVAPLNVAIGEAWLHGDIEIAEEHLYTEQIQTVLRSAIATQTGAGASPRILLTTLPDELHALGLLMVEATLVCEGATCIALGTQTPAADLAAIGAGNAFDVLALSFSSAFPRRRAVDSLIALRGRLPASIPIWVGGSGISGYRPTADGITVFRDLDSIVLALQQWRNRGLS
ncbi:MAG: MerR family transcriptional regulator [Zoogloeaceae bacterium]|nr:MerR family transcriptional regulator [Rhodocyclaceae bacterium]MCP5235206.1 MerR family transcriptional regulator [Zoogloeaceae bacterium]